MQAMFDLWTEAEAALHPKTTASEELEEQASQASLLTDSA